MSTIRQEFSVTFRFDVHFTEDVFHPRNRVLADVVEAADDPVPGKVLAVIDDGLLPHYPDLPVRFEAYCRSRPSMEAAGPAVVIPGGETAKNDPGVVERLHEAIYQARLCRHSYVLAVGGGSVIDVAGYAAATAHRGIRLVRIPTTVLSQNDSAIGVKNGINAFSTKNFLGTFVPPYSVVNDRAFLRTLEDRDWRSGISEAVKVALVKDAGFFREIEADVGRLAPPVRDEEAMNRLIHRCAELHLKHIATSGDPFEMGSSRPLDFGHWAAHKLEELTEFRIRHGEAVAIGIALDSAYSYLKGTLDEASRDRIVGLFERLGFTLYVPEMDAHLANPDHPRCILRGLESFREHLGGELTIMLLESIGCGTEVHAVDYGLYRRAVAWLREGREIAENAA